MKQAIVSGVPMTKRDIFYQNVQLFGKQKVVDQLVDDLAATWGTTRAALNVVSTLVLRW